MGQAESSTKHGNVYTCVQETAEKLGVSTVDVLRALKDMKVIQEAYSIDNIVDREKFFLTPDLREVFADALEAELLKVKSTKQCLDMNKGELAKIIRTPKLLGKGSFGTVYSGCTPPSSASSDDCDANAMRFALKVAGVSKAGFNAPQKNWWKVQAWQESYITLLVQDELLKKGKGQAFPLMYRQFACENGCVFPEKKKPSSCIITLTELGNGTLNKWAETDLASQPGAWENVLFQFMAGIAALQDASVQVFHNDVKAVNTLYYKVQPGGVWHYNIGGVDYWIPNLGFVIVIADYGVSMPLSPDHPYKIQGGADPVGYRGFIRNPETGVCSLVDYDNHDDYDTGIRTMSRSVCAVYPDEIPADVLKNLRTKGHSYSFYGGKIFTYGTLGYECPNKFKKDKWSDDQFTFIGSEGEKVLRAHGFDPKKALRDLDLLRRSDLYPPLQFGDDTQDVIRTFYGSVKRMGQPGPHPDMPNIPSSFRKTLEPYLTDKSRGTDMCEHVYSMYGHKMFAQDFIHHYFKGSEFTKRASGKVLASFKCAL